ncbi:transposase [Xanthomonas fragariae LMG 25863]|nr:transposase [Xanthomonas fragariae LMG 25863]
MQLTFGDAEGLGKRKQTRREIFLAEMEQVVPWRHLLGLIAPHYPVSGRPGRQPYALATMLRIHLLQQWYALSDPAMEEALHQIPTLRRFARLGGLDNVPDETSAESAPIRKDREQVLRTVPMLLAPVFGLHRRVEALGQALAGCGTGDHTCHCADQGAERAEHGAGHRACRCTASNATDAYANRMRSGCT